MDYLGIIYLTLGLGLLQIVLDRGQRADWFNAPWVCYFTAGSITAVVLMVWHETHFPDPILDLTILKIPVFDISVMAIMAMVLILYGTNLLNPLFMQNLMGYTAWRAGVAVAPRGAGTLVAMLLVGQLSRRGFDMRPLVGVGFALVTYASWRMGHWDLEVGSWGRWRCRSSCRARAAVSSSRRCRRPRSHVCARSGWATRRASTT